MSYRFGFMKQIREIAQTGQSVIWVSRGNIPGSYMETEHSAKKVRRDIEECLSSYDYRLLAVDGDCRTYVHLYPEPVLFLYHPERLGMLSCPVRIDRRRVSALFVRQDNSLLTATWNIPWEDCPQNVLTVQDIMPYEDCEILEDFS